MRSQTRPVHVLSIVDGARFQRAAHVPDVFFERIVRDLESRTRAHIAEIDAIAHSLCAQGISVRNRNSDVVSKSRRNPCMYRALLPENISH